MLLHDLYDDRKELIGDDDFENAFDGVNDEDGLPRGTNEGVSERYPRHEHCIAQDLENYKTEFAVGNDFDVDNVKDTIDAPTASEKPAYVLHM